MSETQTDMIMLGYAKAQQANTDRIRTWEIAGTSHADIYEVGGDAGILGCTTPINTGTRSTWWYRRPSLTSADGSQTGHPLQSHRAKLASTHPTTLALDSHGNVIGGYAHRPSTCPYRRSPGPLLPARP